MNDTWAWKPDFVTPPRYPKKISKKQRRKNKKNKRLSLSRSDVFHKSGEWRKLRVRVLEKYECKCMMCGESPKIHGIIIHVDHIKPRSKYPELALDFDNLQVLCEACNMGKSNRYETDWRPNLNKNEITELKILAEAMVRI